MESSMWVHFQKQEWRLLLVCVCAKAKGNFVKKLESSFWMVLLDSLFSKDAANKQVTSIAEMRSKFGFDINKFVHSDYFDKWINVFKSNINYALDN